MDVRYFELHDLLCEALIALEAGDPATAAARVRRALAWAEADWLSTPSPLAAVPAAPAHAAAPSDDGDADDE